MPETDLLVGVVGAGVMGVSLAHAMTSVGITVVIHDNDPAALASAQTEVMRASRLARLSLGRATSDPAPLRTSHDLADLAACHLVVENVTEDVAVKQAVHQELDAVLSADAILAVNTSAVPITSLALASEHPERVVGAHFMNPVATSSMVEVVRTSYTSAHAVEFLTGVLDRMGKERVVVNDAAGFVINRCLMMFVNEAAALLDDGVATAPQVDRLFRGCLGHRTGPLRTADVIGVDTIVDTLHILSDHYGPARFAPSTRLLTMLQAGHLGRKSGRGFYDYGED
ncbi:3-hydroxyacyl-CoA dehydrogenase family protein [Oerskovia sp. NPDC060338]|uniref:3-hydroxyacyl-CoA dehydrogenase family protein n=1 Tax=Oerskovia sp. NPDC060338 TaxID=3347100 RepID=UPI003648113B